MTEAYPFDQYDSSYGPPAPQAGYLELTGDILRAADTDRSRDDVIKRVARWEVGGTMDRCDLTLTVKDGKERYELQVSTTGERRSVHTTINYSPNSRTDADRKVTVKDATGAEKNVPPDEAKTMLFTYLKACTVVSPRNGERDGETDGEFWTLAALTALSGKISKRQVKLLAESGLKGTAATRAMDKITNKVLQTEKTIPRDAIRRAIGRYVVKPPEPRNNSIKFKKQRFKKS